MGRGLQPSCAKVSAVVTGVVRTTGRTYAVSAGVFVLALIAAFVFPQVDKVANPTSTQPGLITFLGVGLAVLALTALMLFVGLRAILPKTAVFLAAAFGYNALLVLVKFALGPLALYAASQGKGFWFLSDAGGYLAFPGLAAIAAILYAGAFFLLYLFFRSDLRRRLGVSVRFETRFLVLLLVMFMVAVVGGLTVIGAFGFLEYTASLVYVLTIGVLIAVALVAAIVLCSVAFRDATEQAVMLRNVTVLSTFAWVGLAFIAAYHIVWLVFVLTLISLWPLKAISAK
jgi:hypothetical protein